MTIEEDLKKIIRKAYDTHVHIGPEIIPRRFTSQSLANYEKGKLAGCVAKNHFYPTAAMINEYDGIDLLGGVVLNNSLGGMNPEAVYAASIISPMPIMVWFPTVNAENFLIKNRFEIAPEWVEDKNIRLKTANEAKPVIVTDNGRLTDDAKKVIDMIARVRAILATGHISPDESLLVADYALSRGISVVVTHPIYQHIDMSVAQQLNLSRAGCFIEQSYSMYSMDGISIKRIADQIKAVGPSNIVLSSDVGQSFSLSPSEALEDFARLLMLEGLSLKDINRMLVINPRRLLGIEH